MRQISRLRRRVALTLCPELGVTDHPAHSFDVDAARQTDGLKARERMNKRNEGRGSVFTLPPEEHAALVTVRRHRRIERAKEILKIIQTLQLRGLPGDEDPAFNTAAERFAVLIFGKE